MKIYIVISGDEDELYGIEVEAIFTNKSQAAMYIISRKEEMNDFRIAEYETDENIYIGNTKPKMIVMGNLWKGTNEFTSKKIIYDYYCCEEIIEKEECFLLSTTVPIETKDSDAFEILKNKFEVWKKEQKEEV